MVRPADAEDADANAPAAQRRLRAFATAWDICPLDTAKAARLNSRIP